VSTLWIVAGAAAFGTAIILAIAITRATRISDEELRGLVRGGQGRSGRTVLEGASAFAWCVVAALVWAGGACLFWGLGG